MVKKKEQKWYHEMTLVERTQKEIQDHYKDARLLKKVMPLIEKLNTLTDIVHVVNCARHGFITLDYRGKATNEEQAREDLARIMSTLQIIFGDIRVVGGGPTRPEGEYDAEYMVNDKIKIRIQLKVNWLPHGCTYHYVRETSYSRGPGRGHYSTYCPTR